MAILNKIRQRSIFLILIIGMALFAFILSGLFESGGFSSKKSQSTIATINGNDISRTDFARKVDAASRNFGPNSSSIQAVNYVWNQELREVVYNEQFEALGIGVGEDEEDALLEESLASNPTFQNEAGVFDKAKMDEYVATNKENPAAYQQWLSYKSTLAKGALEKKYLTMIKAGVGLTNKEGELAYKMENDKIDIKYVQLPFSSIPDAEVTVTDAEIQSYIDAHAAQYKAEASRNLQYVFFKEEPSKEDEDNLIKEVAEIKSEFKSAENVEEYVNENSVLKYNDLFVFKKDLPKAVADTLYNLPAGEVYGPYKDGAYIKISKAIGQRQLPDSIKASHILVSWEGLRTAGETKRTKEEAKKVADSILSLVKEDKEKFAELAKEFSADGSNKDKGGDLGYFAPGRMVPAFNDYVVENQVGDMDVVETDFGYHIISIEDQKNQQKAVKIATIAKEIEPSEKTINTIFANTTKFQMATKDGDFAAKAKESEYTVRPVNKLSELADNIPGIGSDRSIVQWAFNEDTKNGDVKRFDVTGGYAVVQLTGKAEKGVQKVADASSIIKPILIKKKKAEMLKNKIAGSTGLDAIATSQSQTVKTASALNMKNPTISGAGTEPKVVGVAFALEEGKTSQPIVGNNGVYVVEVIKKTPAAAINAYTSYITEGTKSNTGAVNSRVFNALKEASEIEDRRADFY
ncbi:peptidylprolyl isomerase [Aquimarina addita]|uniref:Periplasmic chaperone PpiD n=1 Tax=Aquimarina addita TaxID=870485 RepID=A0ABP6UST4_9FLAO